jgi:proline iminopeptidase
MALPRFVVRVAAIALFVIGVAASVVLSIAAAFQLAKITPRIGLLMTAAVVVCFVVSYATLALASRLWRTRVRRSALFASLVVTVLFVVAMWAAVFRPVPYPHIVPVVRANTQYWSLPSGSRIAYSVYEPPAGMVAKPEPIVFLHGGPGMRANDVDHEFYRQFANDGFKVYLFDQAGSGLSDKLPHATDYTIERFVRDLEEIRQQIAADRLILIGHSWGGTLAAQYAAAYPNHIAKLVFHSPGPPWIESFLPVEDQRTDAAPESLPPLRIIAAIGLSFANPMASENLVSQSELGDWEPANADLGELVCKGERAKIPQNFNAQTTSGMNMYPIITVNRELKRKKANVHTQLNALHVPAIALEGQCDFLPWAWHSMYKKSIPGLREFYFTDAGHYINFSQPDKLAAVIRSFLLDKPPPFAPYESDQDPRPELPKSSKH